MPSDLDLVRQFADNRNEDSFRELFRELTPGLYRYALRFLGEEEDAADVIQETWIRAVTNYSSFRGKSTFRTWLTGICINCCREILKKNDKWENISLEEVAFYKPVETKIELIDMENALKSLSPGYREVLLLHDLEGYKHHEIADMLGINEGTSKSQLFNARRMMRKYLQK